MFQVLDLAYFQVVHARIFLPSDCCLSLYHGRYNAVDNSVVFLTICFVFYPLRKVSLFILIQDGGYKYTFVSLMSLG